MHVRINCRDNNEVTRDEAKRNCSHVRSCQYVLYWIEALQNCSSFVKTQFIVLFCRYKFIALTFAQRRYERALILSCPDNIDAIKTIY